jgi:2-aminoadipate transaminase
MSQRVASLNAEISFARWADRIEPSALQEMLSAATKPGILSFALGLPALELFPHDALAQAAARVLATDARALQYGPPFQPLKTHVVNLMARRGVECGEHQIFLTAGAQQGINLLTRLLLDPGGIVITEEFTYTGFQQVIEPYLPEIWPVPTDAGTGMNVEAVASLLERGARPAFIYTVTDGHNPLAVNMSLEKRRRLVALASRYGVPIIEDDPYGFLYYGAQAVPPLRALDPQWVFYVGSFSKILAPSLRAGWVVVPEELLPKLGIVKEASDINAAPLTQRIIAAYLDASDIEERLTMLRRDYGARRRLMLDALREYFPAQAHWEEPSSGIFVWVELDEGVRTDELLMQAIEQEQVAFIPGNAFSVSGDRGKNCMRLNFSNAPPARIEEGIARLARILHRAPTRS